MLKINFPIYSVLLVFFPFGPAFSANDPVARLQESFIASSAERKEIYSEVIGLAEKAGGDSAALLARTVAFMQRAMDNEDEFIEHLTAQAPGFRNLIWSDPSFLTDYARAREGFNALHAKFPWIESYASCASLVADNWKDGPLLFRSALSFKETYPLSRFWKRLLFLAGCRLLLEKNYSMAQSAFETLWREAPMSAHAVQAYRLVDAVRDLEKIRLTPQQMLTWGRAQGLAGNSTLRKLIDRYPESKEAELAYVEMFNNINRGFLQRGLSSNFRQADHLEQYFSRFTEAFPSSAYFPDILLVRSEFNYRCGKKSQAIARKNDHSWRRSKSKSRQRTSRIYDSHAVKYFMRVSEVDSIALARLPGTQCYFQAGLLSALALIERDSYPEALAKLTSLLEQRPDSVTAVRIIWYTGLLHYLEGDYAKAIEVLSPLERSAHRDHYFWSRAMLFLGKSYQASGAIASAGRAFTLLVREFPYTYHGIRARYLRSKLIPQEPKLWVADLPDINLLRFPKSYTPEGGIIQAAAANWQSLGFFAEAAYIYTNGISMIPKDLLLRFRCHENFLSASWYHSVLRGFRNSFSDFLQQGGANLPDNFWKIAYPSPEPYESIIARQGDAYNIPPALITAIIRQESNFNPRARSHAEAVGLMQLLPSVGRRLSRGMGLGRITTPLLYDPSVNIKLGVKFLTENLSKYDGNIALAISCYNADSRNLPAWLERSQPVDQNGEFDLDLFVELVPLEETHDYNIQVLTNFWRYQELSGEKKNLFCWQIKSFE
ncbi:MAG TPA: transglycosylase SLT domain-containing protein [archaeon]|nr:transglycosylase SLT domain-containing protein [archaeon]